MKTQTRRIITPRNSLIDGHAVTKGVMWMWNALNWEKAWLDGGPSPAGNCGPYWHVPCRHPDDGGAVHRIYPRWSPGDRLWVKETFFNNQSVDGDTDTEFIYRADGEISEQDETGEGFTGWTPSILMPRKASRITLEIVQIRSQRVNEISNEDALAEGICEFRSKPLGKKWYGVNEDQEDAGASPKSGYWILWDQINGEDSWYVNPHVWIYEFKRVFDVKDVPYHPILFKGEMVRAILG